MWIIAGLGNPGPEYGRTRHNAGFWTLERLARAWRARLKRDARAQAEVASVRRQGDAIVLCRPLTYMNESGRAVARLLTRHSLDASRLIVVHDDLDLPTGTLRLREGGGLGGHHGLESIAELAGKDFGRVRVGIGRPDRRGEEDVLRWVLGAPEPHEAELLDEAVERSVTAIETVLDLGWDAAMNRFNRKPD